MAAQAALPDAVFGHYLAAGEKLSPLLPESSSLFRALVSDSVHTVESEVEADSSKISSFFLVLHWSAPDSAPANEAQPEGEAKPAEAPAPAAAVNPKHRTLLQLACSHGSLRVISYLLLKGAEPTLKSPDGLTAYDVSFGGRGRSP